MDHTKELLKLAREGDRYAKEKLVTDNMGLVISTVRHFNPRDCEMEDLVQIGVIGLIKGIDRFNLDMDVKFSTYAVPMIIGEIKRYLRDDGIIRVSRSIRENAVRIERAAKALRLIHNREPSIMELSQETGIEPEDIAAAADAMRRVDSIHRVIKTGDGGEITIADKITDEKDESEDVLNTVICKRLLAAITARERKIILLRYFERKTQTEIAQILGISQVQVSRLEKKILEGFRKQLIEI